jgi:hypothetical protein
MISFGLLLLIALVAAVMLPSFLTWLAFAVVLALVAAFAFIPPP